MKKLIFGMMLALTACVFTSCQKGEGFFNGTWIAVDEYDYYDRDNNHCSDAATIELTLDKKSGKATLSGEYPKDSKQNFKREGSYKFYSDNAIAVTLSATRDDDEDVIILSRSETDDSRLHGYYEGMSLVFTRVKSSTK